MVFRYILRSGLPAFKREEQTHRGYWNNGDYNPGKARNPSQNRNAWGRRLFIPSVFRILNEALEKDPELHNALTGDCSLNEYEAKKVRKIYEEAAYK